MGKGRHVVIHDVIHDDNEMGHRPISYQDEFSRIIKATPLCIARIHVIEMSASIIIISSSSSSSSMEIMPTITAYIKA